MSASYNYAIEGCVVLPEPPSANRYWRHVGKNVVLSKEAKAYRKAVNAALVMYTRLPCFAAGDVSVTLRWYRGRKSGDLDNRIKQVLDAIRGQLYGDDKQITELHAERYEDKADPRIEVEVCAASPTNPGAPR